MHAFVNDLERSVGYYYLYGLWMYETMRLLGDRGRGPRGPASRLADFAQIRGRPPDKIVYSATWLQRLTAPGPASSGKPRPGPGPQAEGRRPTPRPLPSAAPIDRRPQAIAAGLVKWTSKTSKISFSPNVPAPIVGGGTTGPCLKGTKVRLGTWHWLQEERHQVRATAPSIKSSDYRQGRRNAPIGYDAELRRHNEVLRRAWGVQSRDHVLESDAGPGRRRGRRLESRRQAARSGWTSPRRPSSAPAR